jgi:hypothetical protein
MSFRSRTRSTGAFYIPGFPKGVKWLLISNVAIFVIGYFASLRGLTGRSLTCRWFRLTSSSIFHLAAGHVCLSARRLRSHHLEHAGALDVRRRHRTGLGNSPLRAVLLFLRGGRGHLRSHRQLHSALGQSEPSPPSEALALFWHPAGLRHDVSPIARSCGAS